jgi:TonB family protein
MKRGTSALVLLVVLAGGRAWAQDGGVDDGGSEPVLVPPTPLEMPAIEPPAGISPPAAPVEVEVILTISAEGEVTGVEVVRSAGAAFDGAVTSGVRRFRFQPARRAGVPLAVRLPFTHRFLPPPPPLRAPALDAVIEGMVMTRGSRTPVAGATVVAVDQSGEQSAVATDAQGLFVLPVRSGRPLEIRVIAAEHEKFLQHEQLAQDQRLRLKYLVDRRSYGHYEATVRAESDRTEVSRTTLSGREITRVPGTFGDPFRVVNLLPGVSTVMGLLPFPVVRGSSPGNTGVLLDGVRLPYLFHLFAGPSVIHPEFFERVEFYPGGFPVRYGGYTAGIVDGVTRAAQPDERRIDLDLTLTQTGGLVREPIRALGMTVTAAGRIGYPGIVLSLLAPDVSLSYWDYQARLDGGSPRHRWSVFFYGARDEVKTRTSDEGPDAPPEPNPPLTTALRTVFHRLDLRYQHGDTSAHELYRVVLGYDDSFIRNGPFEGEVTGGVGANTWSANPQLRLHRTAGSWLELNLGAESTVRTLRSPPRSGSTTAAEENEVDMVFNKDGWFTASGAFAEVVLRPHPRLRLIPGVRGDLYDERHGSASVTKTSVDPRMLARLRLGGEGSALWLKGVFGRYHQPPRLFVPVPGVDASSLELGLLASTQAALGLEAPLGRAVDLDVNVYFNWMDPVLFDVPPPKGQEGLQQPQPAAPPWQLQPPSRTNNGEGLSDLLIRRQGRSYGLELLLRRRDADRLFGWVSYTLSRSLRRTDTQWEPFDFDRLHILNLVAGVRLPRNWEIGGRILYQSGTPLPTIFGRNISRSDGQFRFDLRIDKRAVWNQWLLDFYIDIINATVAEETGGVVGGESIRYLVPTVGFRAIL